MHDAPVSGRLPVFPWDTLDAAKTTAAAHRGGLIDLSIGTPIDPSPALAQDALTAAADAPGYPTVQGRVELRRAAADWFARRFGVTGVNPEYVVPTIGSKELIAHLPAQLGLGPANTIAFPELAYPTYEVGARYVQARGVAADSTVSFGPSAPTLMFINSPSNPTGRVLGPDHLRKMVGWSRERGVLLVSDGCYLEYVWEHDPEAYSILHPEICDGSHERLVAVHSVSKRSNLAGYRGGFVTGDPGVFDELLQVRKHLGLLVLTPVRDAMSTLLYDYSHVDDQVARYRRRREVLHDALSEAGFRIDHSQAGLYLWA